MCAMLIYILHALKRLLNLEIQLKVIFIRVYIRGLDNRGSTVLLNNSKFILQSNLIVCSVTNLIYNVIQDVCMV